jgi:TolB-like protein
MQKKIITDINTAAPPNGNISELEIREQLEKILCNRQFEKAGRSKAFLSYVVNELLGGRADRIKAYTIGTSVLKREDTFDPQIDPIVRIEAGQLRRRLERYYLTDGVKDPLLIDLPKGGYVPAITRQAPEIYEPNTSRKDLGDRTPDIIPWRSFGELASFGSRHRLIGLSLTICLLLAALASHLVLDRIHNSTVAANSLPRISVTQFQAKDGSVEADMAAGLDERISYHLLRYDTVALTADVQAGDNSVTGPHLILSGSIRSFDGRTRVSFSLINPADGSLTWSDTVERGTVSEPIFDAQDTMAAELAARVAAPYGILTQLAARYRFLDAAGESTYSCYLLTLQSRRTVSLTLHQQAHDCLERVSRTVPDAPEVWALLSLVLMDNITLFPNHHAESEAKTVAAAQTAARLALGMDAHNPIALQAMAAFNLFEGNISEATNLLRHGLSITPGNSELLAEMSRVSAAEGNWEQAGSLMEAAMSAVKPAPGWYTFLLGCRDYQQGDYEQALTNASQAEMEDSPLANYLKIAALSGLNREDEAHGTIQQILDDGLEFDVDDATRRLQKFGLSESVVSSIGDRLDPARN